MKDRDSVETRFENYVNSTVVRVNEKYHCNIVHVHDIQEMEQYIAEHPTEQKIGFLLNSPSYINQPYHYSPIYFERIDNVEHFAQFDSMQAIPYILPKSTNPNISRQQYYSPFQRQVSEEGCLEDAAKILIKCFQEKSIIDFCTKNSIKDDHITTPMTDSESKEYATARNVQYPKNEQRSTILRLQPKVIYQVGLKYLSENNQSPIESLHKLTSLPARFLANIEHYGTMRHFMEKEQEKFNAPYKEGETVLQHIKRKGRMRIDATLPSTSAVDHKKKDDFKGQDFLERQRRYQEKAANPNMSKPVITASIIAKEKFKNSHNHSILEIRHLIELGVDLNGLKDSNGNTPLHALSLCPESTPEDMRALIYKSGIDLNTKGSYDATAIELAVRNKDPMYVKAMLDELPDLHHRDSILMSAMSNPQPIAVMKLLLNHDPSLLEKRNHFTQGWTPLMKAIAENRVEIVKFLLASGANANARARSAFPETVNNIEYSETVSALEIAEQVDQVAKPGEILFAPMIKRAQGMTLSADEPEIKPPTPPAIQSTNVKGAPTATGVPDKKSDYKDCQNQQNAYKQALNHIKKEHQEPKKDSDNKMGSMEI